MLRFLRRVFVRDFGPPPPPDETQQPSASGQTVVETLYSLSRQQRAIIARDATGIYRIHIQFWDTSDWSAGYGAFWAPGGSGGITDTIETARNLAREHLGTLSSNSNEIS
jgi:hypothetical protein